MQSDIVEDDKSWRERMEQAVLEVPLKVNATLSQPIVNLSKLLRLNVEILSKFLYLTKKLMFM